MANKKLAIAAASVTVAGILLGGGALAASADTTPAPSASSSAQSNGPSSVAPKGDRGASQDTAVTGADADKVIAAVQAQDSTVTIDSVRMDPDGSYDALGTRDGAPVFFDVSADLATITENTGGPGGGHGGGPGGPGASQDTAVTGADADKVIAAVQAQDSTVTIDSVRMDPDGSYDALGTRDGAPVFFEVSADLATITENTGGPGGAMGGPMGPMGAQDAPQAPGATSDGSNA